MPPANTVYMTDAPPPYPGINGNNGYSNGAAGAGAGGWTAPQTNSSAQMTSAEASAPPVQTAYFDPNNPGQAYVPPPAYYNDPPPGYTDTTDKKND